MSGLAFEPPGEFEEYRLVRLVRRGGMGQVYLAHDTLLDRAVAVKFIAAPERTAEGQTERLREQFFIEARALARLQHPNVLAIHRVGEVRRRPYLVSEFVRGKTLDELPRPVAIDAALSIGIGLSRGLAAAHRRGVLHRDIKPANAMLTEDGEAKLLDFGLALLFEPGAAVGAPSELAREIVGTPHYIPPEIWRGESFAPAADIYALGALLYELVTGHPPHADVPAADLARVAATGPSVSLAERAPPGSAPAAAAFAAAVDRCLAPRPADRFASVDELREALERIRAEGERRAGQELPAGNPYRGLASFEAEHRALFFGRDTEVRTIVDRLRSSPWVLVAGDSGVGKSSLCLAGVLPALAESGWRVLRMVPGRRPLSTLAAALAHALGEEEGATLAEREAAVAASPARLARVGPVVVLVDQLEELGTMAEPAEAAAFARAWANLVAPTRPGLRLLGTIRGDFLTRLATLAPLEDLVGPALFVLSPLTPAGVRAAIVEPARRKGVHFETEAMVDEIAAGAGDTGSLPLLQFALAALWDARDQDRGVVPVAALRARGGVEGALAGHADAVLARLRASERVSARRILTNLVTPEGTRARLREDELGASEAADRAALEALVRGRLVVACEADDGPAGSYALAHEALVTRWETLRGWLAESADARAAEARLARAAAEWVRLGQRADGLLAARQLAELERPDVAPTPDGAALLRASRLALRRRRRARVVAVIAVPAVIALAIGGLRIQTARRLEAAVRERLGAVERAEARARQLDATARRERERAYALFDRGEREQAEVVWRAALGVAAESETAWGLATAALEGAFSLDPDRADVRAGLARVLHARVLVAEARFRSDQAAELRARLQAFDRDGAYEARLRAPARLFVHSEPGGATVSLLAFASDRGGARTQLRRRGTTPLTLAEAPGSYLLVVEAAGRATARLPLLLGRGEELAVSVPLPRAAEVPEDYVYIPPGRFLYGSADDEDIRRQFLRAEPLHAVSTRGYLIGRTEVRLRDWISFLAALPASERARRRPRAANDNHAIELVSTEGGGWALELRTDGKLYRARVGEPFRYEQRDRRAVQDWLRFPVTGISSEDARAFADWMDRSGRLPGARLCDEHEWERAARGADGRRFPGGGTPRADDFNHDATYGRRTLAYGPDEAGAHPASESPHGLHDMAGNASELVRAAGGRPDLLIRGGTWYQGTVTAWSTNRSFAGVQTRGPYLGLRLCADVDRELRAAD